MAAWRWYGTCLSRISLHPFGNPPGIVEPNRADGRLIVGSDPAARCPQTRFTLTCAFGSLNAPDMHWSRQICSAFLAAAFTLGIIAEGHHQCVTVPDHSSARHAQHADDDASDRQTPHECDCLSHCCSLTTAAWTPNEPALDRVAEVRAAPGRTGASQHLASPLRYRLPLALAPPAAG